jgi:hypothetical protein
LDSDTSAHASPDNPQRPISRQLNWMYPKDICHWITNFCGWGATEEKDHKYAFRGLAEDCQIMAQTHDDKPIGWEELYHSTTEYIIKQRKNLHFICLWGGGKRHTSLPSWVPDLTVPYGTNPALLPMITWRAYDASSGGDFQGDISVRILTAKGARVGQCRVRPRENNKTTRRA